MRATFATPLPILSLLAAALLASGCAGERSPVERPRHVFLITVDTLRADHLGYHGYPRDTSPVLDRLAADSVVFERAIAQWPKTGPSFASMFTGQYSQTTGITHKAAVRLPAEYLTLPERLGEAGYRGLAVVSNGVLGKRLGWDQGFEEYWETWKLAPEPSDDPEEYRKYLNARRVNELAVPMLDEHRNAEHLFVWLHYSDPHAPYLLPEDVDNPFLGDEHYVGDELAELDNRATALGDHRELRYYVAQYDANVRFTDAHIGRILEHARELGLLEDALVIFTADHGESLGEHDYYFGHGRLPYQPGAHVPLLFHYPGVIPGGVRVERPVELVHLYPTLDELLDPAAARVPGLEGKSLLPFLLPEIPEPEGGLEASFRLAFSEAGGGTPTTHFRSVQDERFKLIYHPAMGDERPITYELYDLLEDPGETVNLLDEGTPRAARLLRQELDGWMKGSEWIRRDPGQVEEHHEETLKALKALGYAN